MCAGRINALRPNGTKWEALDLGARLPYVTAFGVDQNNELYVLSLEGRIAKLVPSPSS